MAKRHRARTRSPRQAPPQPSPVPSHQRSRTAHAAGTEAVPAAWNDPDDTTPSARHTARQVQGFRRVDQLASIVERSSCLDHVVAAEQARGIFERASGALPGKGRGIDDGAPPVQLGSAPLGPSPVQLAAVRHWQGITEDLGRLSVSVFQTVAIDNKSVSRWADTHGLNHTVAMGVLITALDRPVEVLGVEDRPRAA